MQQGHHRPVPVAADGALRGADRPDVLGRRLQRRHPRRADAVGPARRLDASGRGSRPSSPGSCCCCCSRSRWPGSASGSGLSVPTVEVANQVTFTVLFPITFVSNVFVPTATLPDWLQPFAEWNPTSTLTSSLRILWGNPNPPTGSTSLAATNPILVTLALDRRVRRRLRVPRRPPLSLAQPLKARRRHAGASSPARSPGRRASAAADSGRTPGRSATARTAGTRSRGRSRCGVRGGTSPQSPGSVGRVLPVPAGDRLERGGLLGVELARWRTSRYARRQLADREPLGGDVVRRRDRTSRSVRPPGRRTRCRPRRRGRPPPRCPRSCGGSPRRRSTRSSPRPARPMRMISWPSAAVVAARVAVGALVAAAGLAADQALAEVLPPAAFLDARRTDVERRVDLRDPDRVVARRDHRAHRTITCRGTSNESRTRTADGDTRPTPGRDAAPAETASAPRPPPADGPENRRWREVLAEGGPILADGAMGTMLFAAGLQFGDPPETWNVAHPDVVRRIHRGYLDAGSRIVMTNTFGGNRLRLRLARPRRARRGAEPDRGDPAPGGGRRGRRPGARRRRHRADRRDHGAARDARARPRPIDVFAEQAAALIAGGVDLIWIETMSHLSEIGAAIRGVAARVAERSRSIATMTFDTRGYTMMGVSPEPAVAALRRPAPTRSAATAATARTSCCRSSRRCTRSRRTSVLVAKSNAGMPELVDLRAVYRAEPPTMAEAGLGVPGRRARGSSARAAARPRPTSPRWREALGVALTA